MSKVYKSIVVSILLIYFITSFFLYKTNYFVFIQIATLLILSLFAFLDIKNSLKKKDDKLILKIILYTFIFCFLIFSILSIFM